jgi:hypothetical protein
MITKERIYFIAGFIFQLILIANFAYWYTLLSAHRANDAVQLYLGNFPEYLRDVKVIVVAAAVCSIISMLCYGAARKLSFSKGFRNVVAGLILIDSIVLLVICIGLM